MQHEHFRVVAELDEAPYKLYLEVSAQGDVAMVIGEDSATVFEASKCAKERMGEYVAKSGKELKIYVEVETYDSARNWYWAPINVMKSVNRLSDI